MRTTLDWALQRQVEVALANHLDRVGSRHITQAGVIVLRNSDGAVLAMVGSRNYTDEDGNGAYDAVTARLRPGSTLKPFVYGAAFERGDTPATIALDLVLPPEWRLVGGIEALTGILMCGLSTGMFFSTSVGRPSGVNPLTGFIVTP